MVTAGKDSFGKTQVAKAPFDRESADVILCTSDQVHFYLHAPVLSLASTVLEGMFTIPQPSNPEESSSSISSSRPVIDVTEDSTTMDCLLRYCYPVVDPDITDLNTLDLVLTAAYKYDIEVAITMAIRLLHTLVSTSPLFVYAISCNHDLENLARKAADAWKTTREQWQDHVEKFEDALSGLSYIPEMAGRVTAGSYFRLLQHLRGVHVWTFCNMPSSIDSTFTMPLQFAAVNLACSALENFPFNRPDADLIMRSGDGTDFPVHRVVLELQLVHNQQGMTTIFDAFSSPPDERRGDLPVVKTGLPRNVLALLLKLCYPIQPGDNFLTWEVEEFTSTVALSAARAAVKHGFRSVSEIFTARLNELIPRDPLAICCAAIRLGWSTHAQAAARALATTRVDSMYCKGMEFLPVENYLPLVRHYHECQVAVYRTLLGRQGLGSLSSIYAGKATSRVMVSHMEHVVDRVRRDSAFTYTREISLQEDAELSKEIESVVHSVSCSTSFHSHN